MLKMPHIRYRQRELEERRRGATPTETGIGPLWRQIFSQMLVQIAQRMPWAHLGLALAVALLAGSIPWLSSHVLDAMDRQISHISVEGELNGTDRASLESRLQPWLGRSFFASDLEQIKADVESEAWVDTAAVRRVWPDGLTVEVVEHEPIAFWNASQLLTRKGEVISPDSVAAAGNLPHLSGPGDRAGEVLEMARQFSERLGTEGLRLAELVQEERGAWTLKLDNGITVELGRDRIDRRLERFLTVYRSHLSTQVSDVVGVDARYSNGIAVRWKDSARENI